MGVKQAYIAVKEENFKPDEITLGFKDSEFIYLHEEEFSKDNLIAESDDVSSFLMESGWYLVVFHYMPNFVYEKIPQLSKEKDLLFFEVSETSMTSVVEYWQKGKKLWSLDYDKKEGYDDYTIYEKGDIPSFYETIKAPIWEGQQEANRNKEGVDYMIDTLDLVAQEIVGYSYQSTKNRIVDSTYKDYKKPLLEIVECLEMQSLEIKHYFDRVENRFVFTIEEDDNPENLKLLKAVEDRKRFIPLPDGKEINEYEIMQEFSETQNDEYREILLKSLKGKGAFRRFKDSVFELDIQKAWFAFKKEQLPWIAYDWVTDEHLFVRFDLSF